MIGYKDKNVYNLDIYKEQTRLCKSLDLVMLFWHKSINIFFVCAHRNLRYQDHDPKPPIFHLQALPHRYKSIPLTKESTLILVTPAQSLCNLTVSHS